MPKSNVQSALLRSRTGALNYLKETLQTIKGIKSPEAVFVAASK
ncbi:MAG: hypothetical protein V7L01_23760 [Nostoc sp.]